MRGGEMKGALVLAIACVSCGNPPKGETTPATAPTPPIPTAAMGSSPGSNVSTVGSKGARRVRIEAPHGGAINLLSTSVDGKTVVSVDELGGTRLWAALDGSAEPRVIDLPRPTDLVVGAHAKGYVLAMTDSVGGLILQIVDRDGITLQRATMPIEPAYGGVAGATERGVLAWRVDQRIVLLSPDKGSVLSELPTEGGQRLLALAANADKAVAVIDNGTTKRARWITLSPQLAWGAFIEGADDLGSNIALSPSGKRVASLLVTPARGICAIVLDAAGKLIANEPAPGATAVALPTDDHVALAIQNGVSWIDLSKVKKPQPTRPPPTTGANAPVPQPIADIPIVGVASGGRAVGAVNGELVIATPNKSEFLGYELESPAVASAGPNGQLLIGLGETFALLDGKLVASAPPDLQIPSGSAVADVRWLAGNEWLVQSSRLNDGITGINLVDAAGKRTFSVRKGMAMVHMMAHEPSTNLVALSLGDTPELLRHAPGKLELKTVSTMPKPKGFERAELVPVNPSLAGGTHVVVVHMRDRLTIRWAKDPQRLESASPIVVDGSLASIDAAGHVYVWQSDANGQLVLAMYRDGKPLGFMPTDGPTALWPDPTGTRVLQVSQRSVAMVGVDTTRKWALPLQGVTEAIWLDANTIAIISAAGIARVDANTGDVQAARCGWRFGLSSKQHPISPRVEPVCTQLR
ncbi:MAG: hypothetical protein H0T65_24230 [Deltaproteobacteria bacterium]|nr:hypothetical protein [Deltaproteobacteria bacterium]